VAQDSPIHHLREEGRLRDEFAHQVWDIFLSFGRKRFLVARATAERDDYYLPLPGRDACSSDQAGGPQETAQRHSCGAAYELAAGPCELACEF
jgi:hypothetical protein